MYVLKESRQTDIDLLTRMRTMSQIVEDKCKKPFIQSFCLQDQLKETVPFCRQTFMFFIWRKPASTGLFSVLKEREISVWHFHFNAIFMWQNHWSSHVNLRLVTKTFHEVRSTHKNVNTIINGQLKPILQVSVSRLLKYFITRNSKCMQTTTLYTASKLLWRT